MQFFFCLFSIWFFVTCPTPSSSKIQHLCLSPSTQIGDDTAIEPDLFDEVSEEIDRLIVEKRLKDEKYSKTYWTLFGGISSVNQRFLTQAIERALGTFKPKSLNEDTLLANLIAMASFIKDHAVTRREFHEFKRSMQIGEFTDPFQEKFRTERYQYLQQFSQADFRRRETKTKNQIKKLGEYVAIYNRLRSKFDDPPLSVPLLFHLGQDVGAEAEVLLPIDQGEELEQLASNAERMAYLPLDKDTEVELIDILMTHILFMALHINRPDTIESDLHFDVRAILPQVLVVLDQLHSLPQRTSDCSCSHFTSSNSFTR